MNRLNAVLPAIALVALSTYARANEGDWTTLRSPHAEATTHLQTSANRFVENYHPNYVLDDDRKTAWVEGVEGLGEGQVLTLPLSRVRQADEVRVRIRNGYQKSASLLRANAAPERVRVTLYDRQGGVAGEVEATLAKEMGWQDIIIPVGGREFERLELDVLSVHEGGRYRDTCISDVLVDVRGSGQYSATVEGFRFSEATAWMAERAQAAAYFASQPNDYPFASTAFTLSDAQQDTATVTSQLQAARADTVQLKRSAVWYRSTRTRPAVRLPDGGGDLSPIVGVLKATERAWFEAETELLSHTQVVGDGDNENESSWIYNDRIRWADDAKSSPARVLHSRKDVSDGRGLWVQESSTLLDYDEQGRLTRAYIVLDSQTDIDSPSYAEQLVMLEWAGAEIVGWTVAYRHAEPNIWIDPGAGSSWRTNEEFASYQYSEYRAATP